MAAKTFGTFIEDYTKEHGRMPGLVETWWAAIKSVEVQKPSHNSGYTGEKPSPQMPSWEVAIKSVLFKTREERDVAAAIYENIARHFA